MQAKNTGHNTTPGSRFSRMGITTTGLLPMMTSMTIGEGTFLPVLLQFTPAFDFPLTNLTLLSVGTSEFAMAHTLI